MPKEGVILYRMSRHPMSVHCAVDMSAQLRAHPRLSLMRTLEACTGIVTILSMIETRRWRTPIVCSVSPKCRSFRMRRGEPRSPRRRHAFPSFP